MTSERIDWDKLRVFKVVAELGSMTAAAARLGESPPTVSRKIDELETALKSQLFNRSTRGMELTEAGKIALRHAYKMDEAATLVLQEAGSQHKGIEGRITIGMGDGLGPYWIAPSMAEFNALNPKIQVTMHVSEEIPDLLGREADIAIQFTEPRHPEIIARKLGTLHYIGFASEAYLKDNPEMPSSFFEYYHHRCILHEAYVNQVDRWAPKVAELKKMIDYAFVTNSASAMIELCKKGGGIALMPTYMAEVFPELVPLAMSEVAPIQFWMAYTERTRRMPEGQAMLDWIRSLFDSATTVWFRDSFMHPKDVGQESWRQPSVKTA